MHTPAFWGRLALLLGLLLAARPGSAQYQYATAVVSATNTANSSAAVDGSTATEATLQPPLLVGMARLRVSFPNTVQPGEQAGLMLRTGGALGLAALAGLEVRTYLGSGSSSVQNFALGSLVSLGVLNAGLASAAFTVTQPFNQIELTARGVANLYTIGFVQAYATTTPLPVELVAFRGQATPGGVLLTWQTASERNNDHFDVERSPAAEGDAFVPVGRVAGAGTSAQARRYEWLDAAPLARAYYRLRQVDADGQAHYSAVVAVQASVPAALAAYPSPATATVTIAAPPDAQLSFYDQQGRQLRPATTPAPGQPLDVSSLPAGIYTVRDAATGQSTRFVKLPAGQ